MENFIDIHSHILPRVDDGSANSEMSMKMLRIAADEGIRQIILTPHNKPGRRQADLSRIAAKTEELRDRLLTENLDIKLYIGSELYYRSSLFEEIESGLAGTLAGSHYVLVEFGPLDDFDYIRGGIYTMLMNGYHPVLAHVERYRNVCAKVERINELVEMGCYIQVNAGSIMGKFGIGTRQFTKKLLRQHLVHFVATDAHDLEKRAPRLADCADYIRKKFGKDYQQRLLYDNPMCILQDKFIMDWKDR